MARVRAWRPEVLCGLADSWDQTARIIHAHVRAASEAVQISGETWKGATGETARRDAAAFAASGDAIARALVLAAVAARDGADQIAAAQRGVTSCVESARAAGFVITDDGSVVPGSAPPAMLIALSGGDVGVASAMLTHRAAELSKQLVAAVNHVGDADEDAAFDIREAFDSVTRSADTARGNADGVSWDVRIEANRTLVAQSVVEHLGDPLAVGRSTFYRGLLGEIDDPAGTGRRIDRKILAFDPRRASLIELNGDLGGPFPRGDTAAEALLEAASPVRALEMAPRLVSFSRDVDAAVDATGRAIPITYVGHSYGGSILGTAEALGLTADRTLYVAAAGAGVGVDGPEDWHDRNTDVLRFSMTAPGDPIQLVQGIPGGPHGADPDTLPGVIHLATGHYDDGRPMAGPRAHTDVIDAPASDAWRNVLAVITGDRLHIRVAS